MKTHQSSRTWRRQAIPIPDNNDMPKRIQMAQWLGKNFGSRSYYPDGYSDDSRYMIYMDFWVFRYEEDYTLARLFFDSI